MYLLKGPITDDRMAVSAIYDLSHPRNAGVNRAGGVEVDTEPNPPGEEGMGYRIYYDLAAQAYEYEAYPLPKEPEPVEETQSNT